MKGGRWRDPFRAGIVPGECLLSLGQFITEISKLMACFELVLCLFAFRSGKTRHLYHAHINWSAEQGAQDGCKWTDALAGFDFSLGL